MNLKHPGHITDEGRNSSTMWQHKVTFLLTFLLILIIGSRLQAQTVTIDATLANTIQTTLNGGSDYTVTSTSDIIVSSSITKSAGSSATLTLKAARHISLQTGANITASNGALNLHLWADSDNSSDGINQIASNINTNGGWLKAGNDNQTATINNISTRVGGDVFFNMSSPQTISTNGGQIDIYGETIVSNTSGLTINSGNGNVTLYGLLNSGNQYTGVNYSGKTWLEAQAQADADNNANTYLATITSRLENSIAALSVSYNTAWLGARREANGFWRWEKGPEALQGLTYTNWATNEPNNFGTEINGLGYPGENALQFTGANGNWNDLWDNGIRPGIDFLDYYVLEFTLVASPVTIIAGSGTVTFEAAVGGSKPLSSLNITAATTAINGGSVTTNSSFAGSQSYSGNITLGSASTTLNMLDTPLDFKLANGKSVSNATNADATLTIKNAASIILEAGSSISSNNGKLNVILWADTDANGGYIRTNSGSSITTNGGHLWMGGGSGSNTWNGLTVGNGYALGNELNSNGILIIGSSIATNGGNVALFGKSRPGAAVGTDGSAVNTNVDGIRISPIASSLINSGAGSIVIEGVSQGTDQVALGVEFCSLSPVTHLITSSASGDAITITGVGSQSSGTQVNTNGVFVHNGTTISSTGGGNIKIRGVGGSVGSTQQSNYFSTGSHVNPGSGNLTVTGNSIYLAGTFSGSGILTIQPETIDSTIGIGEGAGTLQLPARLFSTNFTDGFSSITIGSANAGDITVNSVTFRDNTRLLNGGKVIIGAGQTVTATNVRLQIDNGLTLGTGAKIVR